MKTDVKKLVKKRILGIKPYKPGKPIEEVRRELGLKSIIKLASNENAYPPSKKITRAIEKNLKYLNRYPERDCFRLKKALGEKYNLKKENIIIGNGSDELIVLALRAFGCNGDEVVIAKPTFLIYEIASRVEGVKVVTVPMKDFRYDLQGMADRLTRKTKIVFIANPDNPVGTYVRTTELAAFLKKVNERTIVFIDEAYFEFACRYPEYPATLKYIKTKNVIITRTFSKVYGLAGIRVGYGFARKELIEAMDRVREPFNVNSLAQVAAEAALKDRAFVTKCISTTEAGKKYLEKEIAQCGHSYIKSATNFILINVGKNAKVVYTKLLKRGVIVREMSAWGLNGFIRVTVGTMKENKRFIKALKKI